MDGLSFVLNALEKYSDYEFDTIVFHPYDRFCRGEYLVIKGKKYQMYENIYAPQGNIMLLNSKKMFPKPDFKGLYE